MIEQIGAVSFCITREGTPPFHMTLNPTGDVNVFSGFENIAQSFTCPRPLTSLKEVLEFLPLDKIRKAARLHTEGTLNKEKFQASIDLALEKRIITKNNHYDLSLMIKTCTCTPPMVYRKLCYMGYKHLVEHPDFHFTDDLPEFKRSLELMAIVLEDARGLLNT